MQTVILVKLGKHTKDCTDIFESAMKILEMQVFLEINSNQKHVVLVVLIPVVVFAVVVVTTYNY